MDITYIVVIVIASLFFVLFIAFLFADARGRSRSAKLQQRIDEAYSDGNIVKMEYDFAVYDEEPSRGVQRGDRQVTIYDVLKEGAAQPDFAKIEQEGLEEITGNYKPEQ